MGFLCVGLLRNRRGYRAVVWRRHRHAPTCQASQVKDGCLQWGIPVSSYHMSIVAEPRCRRELPHPAIPRLSPGCVPLSSTVDASFVLETFAFRAPPFVRLQAIIVPLVFKVEAHLLGAFKQSLSPPSSNRTPDIHARFSGPGGTFSKRLDHERQPCVDERGLEARPRMHASQDSQNPGWQG